MGGRREAGRAVGRDTAPEAATSCGLKPGTHRPQIDGTTHRASPLAGLCLIREVDDRRASMTPLHVLTSSPRSMFSAFRSYGSYGETGQPRILCYSICRFSH